MSVTCMLCEADVTGMREHTCPETGQTVMVEDQLWLGRRVMMDAATLPAPPDPCVKCGSTDRHTAFHVDRNASFKGCGYGSHNTANGEHLHHHCRGCGYDWTERTREAKMNEAELRAHLAKVTP